MKTILAILTCFFILHYFQVDVHDIKKVNEIYDKRIMSAYGINYDEMIEACQTASDKNTCKKAYILNMTNLTENEYTDIFVHPLGELTNIDVKSSYQRVKEEYSNMKKLLKYILQLLK